MYIYMINGTCLWDCLYIVRSFILPGAIKQLGKLLESLPEHIDAFLNKLCLRQLNIITFIDVLFAFCVHALLLQVITK